MQSLMNEQLKKSYNLGFPLDYICMAQRLRSVDRFYGAYWFSLFGRSMQNSSVEQTKGFHWNTGRLMMNAITC